MTRELQPAVWVNGVRHPLDGPHLSSHDRGFTLADGVFETMRAFDGIVFRLERHLARLERALAVLDIPAPPSLRSWVHQAMPDAGRDAAVRLTVTRGPGDPGVAPPADPRPTVVIAVSAPPRFNAAIYESGVTAHVATGRLNEHAMTAGLKTLAYTDAVVALLEARRAGAQEALLLDTASHCAEATSSNLFVVARGLLVTPPLSCGVLPGVTREAVLGLAERAGVSAAERPVGLDELLGADEAFLTSSLRGIAPLVRIGTHAIGQGRPGTVTARVTEAYRALVAHECRASATAGFNRDR